MWTVCKSGPREDAPEEPPAKLAKQSPPQPRASLSAAVSASTEEALAQQPSAPFIATGECVICQEMLRFTPSTPTTARLIVSMLPCSHQFHRLCIERLVPAPAPGISSSFSCPVCRRPGQVVAVTPLISSALWSAGHRPECMCEKGTHELLAEYEACPWRPRQCEMCRAVVPHRDLEPDANGTTAHNVDCVPDTGTQCKNNGCTVHTGDAEAAAHAISCAYRKVSCNMCDQIMPYAMFSKHYVDVCKKRGKKCTFCERLAQLMPDCFIPKHPLRAECPIYRLLTEAVRNTRGVTAYIADADAEQSASMNFSEVPDAMV